MYYTRYAKLWHIICSYILYQESKALHMLTVSTRIPLDNTFLASMKENPRVFNNLSLESLLLLQQKEGQHDSMRHNTDQNQEPLRDNHKITAENCLDTHGTFTLYNENI